MSISSPNCPSCQSPFAYQDHAFWVCPECGHEWDPDAPITEGMVVKDANGNALHDGDFVTLIKDLKVKGTSTTAKIGTKIKINRLVSGDHNIDCKVDGIGPMMLKSEFVKKA